MSAKHLQRYVDEFAGRHSIRERDTLDQMQSVVAGMVGKRLSGPRGRLGFRLLRLLRGLGELECLRFRNIVDLRLPIQRGAFSHDYGWAWI